jgi:hypothetical protein
MALQTINIGTVANDGSGDPLRTAMDKVNDNIAETLNKTGDTMSGGLAFSGTSHAGVKLISLTTAQINALTPAVGMVVYDSTVGKYKAYGTAGWFEIDGGVFNVKSFGAKGDGVTEAGAAIQLACCQRNRWW